MSHDRKFKRTLSYFERLGAKMFGFQDAENRDVWCVFTDFARFIEITTDVLPSYIGGNGSSAKYFGFFRFANRVIRRLIKLTGSVKVGPWLAGNVELTGTGLVYICFLGRHCAMKTIENITRALTDMLYFQKSYLSNDASFYLTIPERIVFWILLFASSAK